MKLLVEKSIESNDRYHRTLLWQAAEKGYDAVTKLLVEKSANLESNDVVGHYYHKRQRRGIKRW